MLFQWPPQRRVPCRDRGVVPGPNVQFVIVLEQQGPFAGVELWCGALRLNDELAGVLLLLLFLLLRHKYTVLRPEAHQLTLYTCAEVRDSH